MLRTNPRREGQKADPVQHPEPTMSLSKAVVQTGYEYLAALLQELDLFLAEPSWFRAFRTARQAQDHMHRHVQALYLFLEEQLAREPGAGGSDTLQWRDCHQQAEHTMARLLAAVEQRNAAHASQWLHELHGHLRAALTGDLLLIERLETIGDDLSRPLSHAIQGHTVP